MTPFPSPNFGERRGGVSPSLVVIHYTAISCDEARARPAADGSNVVHGAVIYVRVA